MGLNPIGIEMNKEFFDKANQNGLDNLTGK
jgi:hypothetical protein